jgi:hypothetical protein
MITRTLAVTVIAAALVVGRARGDSRNEPHPWVLLGLDVHMGAVTERDTAKEANTVSVYGEGLPVYETRGACQADLRRAIQRYAGRSHAEGNFGSFLCADIRTWTHGE